MILNYSEKKTVEYSENSFSIQANNFEKAILAFYTDAKNNIDVVKSHFPDKIEISASLSNRKFIIDFIKRNPAVFSVGFFKGENQIVCRKESSSYVYSQDKTI